MSFTLTPPVAAACRDWDDQLFRVYRILRQTEEMPAVLLEIGMHSRAAQAGAIHGDLLTGLMTGTLLARMNARLIESHPVLNEPGAAELLRQLTSALIPLYFTTLPDEAKERPNTIRDSYVAAWTAALGDEESVDA